MYSDDFAYHELGKMLEDLNEVQPDGRELRTDIHVKKTGDFIPTAFNTKWGADYFKFTFDKMIDWDSEKDKQLNVLLKTRYPKFEVMRPLNKNYVRLSLKHLPTLKKEHFEDQKYQKLIFNMEGYEGKRPSHIFDKIVTKNYKPYSYFDNYGGESIEDLETAEQYSIERLSFVLDPWSITVKTIKSYANLLGELGSLFFGAKTK